MLYPNIAAERARKGWSTTELAEKLGVNRKTLYNWENAGKIPDVALGKMADLFGVSVDYLLGYDKEVNHDRTAPRSSGLCPRY